MTEQTKTQHLVEFTRESILADIPSVLWEKIQSSLSNKTQKVFAKVVPLAIAEVPDEEILKVKEPTNRFQKRTYLNKSPGPEKNSYIIELKNKDDLGEIRRLFNLYELKSAIIFTK